MWPDEQWNKGNYHRFLTTTKPVRRYPNSSPTNGGEFLQRVATRNLTFNLVERTETVDIDLTLKKCCKGFLKMIQLVKLLNCALDCRTLSRRSSATRSRACWSPRGRGTMRTRRITPNWPLTGTLSCRDARLNHLIWLKMGSCRFLNHVFIGNVN